MAAMKRAKRARQSSLSGDDAHRTRTDARTPAHAVVGQGRAQTIAKKKSAVLARRSVAALAS